MLFKFGHPILFPMVQSIMSQYRFKEWLGAKQAASHYLTQRGPSLLAHIYGTRSLLTYKMTWWRHQMETFSALLAICAGNSLVTGEFPTQRPVTRGFVVFFICGWINGWVNSGEAGNMRRHRAHYDVIAMIYGETRGWVTALHGVWSIQTQKFQEIWDVQYIWLWSKFEPNTGTKSGGNDGFG